MAWHGHGSSGEINRSVANGDGDRQAQPSELGGQAPGVRQADTVQHDGDGDGDGDGKKDGLQEMKDGQEK